MPSERNPWKATESERLAYAAGLFDGEGCISISSSISKSGYRRHGLHVLMAMTQTEPLLFMQELFGGNVVGKAAPKNGRKQQWTWSLYSHAAVPFLEAVLPMLRIKDKEAGIALLFQSTFNSGYSLGGDGGQKLLPDNVVQLRSMLYAECKQLKRVNE